jgi:hypothetical protein
VLDRSSGLSEGNVPIECAACGFFIGSGLPGGTYFCSKCQDLVVAKARQGDLGTVIGALAIVGLFIGIGALIADALSN